ncbi:transmembrane protein 41A-like [Diaphorina citri]|uniref:Transmembrane protein 41A-like n=1 Tax=Diaphorina citri TaxID=121845 RepID=A0A3Q0J760_DIACI|nr:transmembrane protein 41A-like [Diaphorina citri]KAI5711864.1 hypothetical protein M8J75_003719 [Diaphorina citri]KAI5749729.1 hypothetical protein M8J76_009667 [Diaphorina citri]KAI5754495.1 hypothetical protein M8J77_009010 [Diaphorina citri]KAI5755392.1 hypothetical protein M8J77_016431 [Diaphorina citri]
MANSFYIIPIFTAALLWLYILGIMAPKLPNKNLNNQITMKIPSNYQDVKRLADLFEAYYEDHYFYVILVFVSTYLVKQAFIIPGSAIMNIVGGALFGLYIGWPLCCCLTALGATSCFLLSDIFLKPLMASYFPDKIDYLKTEVEKNRNNLVFYLLSIRVLPITPNFLVNLLSPFIGIPLRTFFFTTLFGLMPYNFVCVQAGSLLSSLSSLDNVFGLDMIIKLSTMALVLVLPSLFNYSYQRL